jgi:hypothetical protein
MSQQHHCPYTFKNLAACSCFNRAVHQAMLDTCDLANPDEFVIPVNNAADAANPDEADLPSDASDSSLPAPCSDPDDHFGVAALVVALCRT